MKQKGGEEKKGVDDEPQAAQQSIDYMNMLHSLEESMLKDLSGKSDMFFSIIKGELLLHCYTTFLSDLQRSQISNNKNYSLGT